MVMVVRVEVDFQLAPSLQSDSLPLHCPDEERVFGSHGMEGGGMSRYVGAPPSVIGPGLPIQKTRAAVGPAGGSFPSILVVLHLNTQLLPSPPWHTRCKPLHLSHTQ